MIFNLFKKFRKQYNHYKLSILLSNIFFPTTRERNLGRHILRREFSSIKSDPQILTLIGISGKNSSIEYGNHLRWFIGLEKGYPNEFVLFRRQADEKATWIKKFKVSEKGDLSSTLNNNRKTTLTLESDDKLGKIFAEVNLTSREYFEYVFKFPSLVGFLKISLTELSSITKVLKTFGRRASDYKLNTISHKKQNIPSGQKVVTRNIDYNKKQPKIFTLYKGQLVDEYVLKSSGNLNLVNVLLDEIRIRTHVPIELEVEFLYMKEDCVKGKWVKVEVVESPKTFVESVTDKDSLFNLLLKRRFWSDVKNRYLNRHTDDTVPSEIQTLGPNKVKVYQLYGHENFSELVDLIQSTFSQSGLLYRSNLESFLTQSYEWTQIITPHNPDELAFLLLLSTDVNIATLLGLHTVDRGQAPDFKYKDTPAHGKFFGNWDYKIEGQWSTNNSTQKYGAIFYDLLHAKSPRIETPPIKIHDTLEGISFERQPSISDDAPTGNRRRFNVGLGWDLEQRFNLFAPVAFDVFRNGNLLTTKFDFDGITSKIAPFVPARTEEKPKKWEKGNRKIKFWSSLPHIPPFSFPSRVKEAEHVFVDESAPFGSSRYKIRGVDIFGRYQSPGPEIQHVVNPIDVAVPSPLNLSSEIIKRGTTFYLTARWDWDLEQRLFAPDLDKFEVYWFVGKQNITVPAVISWVNESLSGSSSQLKYEVRFVIQSTNLQSIINFADLAGKDLIVSNGGRRFDLTNVQIEGAHSDTYSLVGETIPKKEVKPGTSTIINVGTHGILIKKNADKLNQIPVVVNSYSASSATGQSVELIVSEKYTTALNDTGPSILVINSLAYPLINSMGSPTGTHIATHTAGAKLNIISTILGTPWDVTSLPIPGSFCIVEKADGSQWVDFSDANSWAAMPFSNRIDIPKPSSYPLVNDSSFGIEDSISGIVSSSNTPRLSVVYNLRDAVRKIWNSSDTYDIGDLIQFKGRYYESKIPNNTDHEPPTNSIPAEDSNWREDVDWNLSNLKFESNNFVSTSQNILSGFDIKIPSSTALGNQKVISNSSRANPEFVVAVPSNYNQNNALTTLTRPFELSKDKFSINIGSSDVSFKSKEVGSRWVKCHLPSSLHYINEWRLCAIEANPEIVNENDLALTWSLSTMYEEEDIVAYGSAFYISKVGNNKGNIPTTGIAGEDPYWNQLSGTVTVQMSGLLSKKHFKIINWLLDEHGDYHFELENLVFPATRIVDDVEEEIEVELAAGGSAIKLESPQFQVATFKIPSGTDQDFYNNVDGGQVTYRVAGNSTERLISSVVAISKVTISSKDYLKIGFFPYLDPDNSFRNPYGSQIRFYPSFKKELQSISEEQIRDKDPIYLSARTVVLEDTGNEFKGYMASPVTPKPKKGKLDLAATATATADAIVTGPSVPRIYARPFSGSSSYALSWSPPSPSLPNATYNVFRISGEFLEKKRVELGVSSKQDVLDHHFNEIADAISLRNPTPRTTTSYTDKIEGGEGQYYYKIITQDASGQPSDWASSPVIGPIYTLNPNPPDPPTLLKGPQIDGKVTLEWDVDPKVDQYWIYRMINNEYDGFSPIKVDIANLQKVPLIVGQEKKPIRFTGRVNPTMDLFFVPDIYYRLIGLYLKEDYENWLSDPTLNIVTYLDGTTGTDVTIIGRDGSVYAPYPKLPGDFIWSQDENQNELPFGPDMTIEYLVEEEKVLPGYWQVVGNSIKIRKTVNIAVLVGLYRPKDFDSSNPQNPLQGTLDLSGQYPIINNVSDGTNQVEDGSQIVIVYKETNQTSAPQKILFGSYPVKKGKIELVSGYPLPLIDGQSAINQIPLFSYAQPVNNILGVYQKSEYDADPKTAANYYSGTASFDGLMISGIGLPDHEKVVIVVRQLNIVSASSLEYYSLRIEGLPQAISIKSVKVISNNQLQNISGFVFDPQHPESMTLPTGSVTPPTTGEPWPQIIINYFDDTNMLRTIKVQPSASTVNDPRNPTTINSIGLSPHIKDVIGVWRTDEYNDTNIDMTKELVVTKSNNLFKWTRGTSTILVHSALNLPTIENGRAVPMVIRFRDQNDQDHYLDHVPGRFRYTDQVPHLNVESTYQIRAIRTPQYILNGTSMPVTLPSLYSEEDVPIIIKSGLSNKEEFDVKSGDRV